MIIISLSCYPCGAHQAAPEEILQKSLQSRQPRWNKCFILLGDYAAGNIYLLWTPYVRPFLREETFGEMR